MTIHDLANHPTPFVTVDELARYWRVSRRHILKQINAGALEAISLGPRLYRVPTIAALKLERMLQLPSSSRGKRTHALLPWALLPCLYYVFG